MEDQYFYVASCVFTRGESELSEKVQTYIRKRYGMPIIRCCEPNYKVTEFENAMPETYRSKWQELPQYETFSTGSTLVSICHNCSAIFEEYRHEYRRLSLWELIIQDESFQFPDYHHEKMTVQDCWRSRENRQEQEAVRLLMKKMNIEIVELEQNYEQTEFCGISLYQPQPPRNPIRAPKRFKDRAQGLFKPHTDEEKKNIMQLYCNQFNTNKAVAYCHYCIDGLNIGGVEGIHLARLLFEPEKY